MKTATIWNERLTCLMKREGYTQETFFKAFKKKYGNCTQTNVSRWCRVGNSISNKNGETKIIGFPTYENMKNIADFFNVSLGYLTGETDFETFEMENVCDFLNIDESTGKAIRNLATGSSVDHFGLYLSDQYKATLKYLVTSKNFPMFIKGFRELAENVYRQKHPIDYQASAIKKINPELVQLAYQCIDYSCVNDDIYGEINDFKENDVNPTPELLDAIQILREARDKDYSQLEKLEYNVKLSKYELLETYFRVLEDVVADGKIVDMSVPIQRDI